MRRQSATAGSKSTAAGSSASAPLSDPDVELRARTTNSRPPSREPPSSPASSTPTRISSCPGCVDACRRATRCRHGRRGSSATVDGRPQRRRTEQRQEAVVAAIGEARASGTTLVGDVSNTLDSCAPLAGERAVGGGVLRAAGVPSARPDWRWSRRREQATGRARDGRRLGRDRAACAVLGLAGSLAGDRPAQPATAAQRASRRVAGGSAVSPRRHRPWRDLLERIGAWAPDWIRPRAVRSTTSSASAC